MSNDLKTVKVLDSRLDVTPELKYAVLKGGQNVTSAKYPAIGKSNSQITFNIQVPSEQTIIDRRVLMRNKWVYTLTGTPAAGAYLVNIGSSDALAPFPCNQCFTTVQSTINNNTVTCNVQDVINFLLRSNDVRELQAFNGMAPNAFDTYQSYADALLSNNNPNGDYSQVADNDLQPRGAFGNVVIAGNTVGDGATAKTVTITFETIEPVMVSPWTWADPKANNQGIYGITNLNFVFNIDSTGKRLFRSGSATAFASNVISEVTESELWFHFITPHPSDLMSARNCVPYYEVPRYTQQVTLTASTAGQVISSQNFQLNQVPDKLAVWVRPIISQQTNKTADYFLPIKKISINWNNQSGLLASASQFHLYQYSRKAGSNQNWLEFYGAAKKVSPAGGDPTNVYTSGSMLMIDYGTDLQLTEDWYAPGSIGNFNLQFDLTVDNTTASTAFELVIVTVNSGIMVTERGSTSIFSSVLDKATVLDASSKDAYHSSDVKRLVGGGFLDTLKSVAGAVIPKALPVAKALLGNMDNKYAKTGADVLGALGYGSSGAGVTGGGKSGGSTLKKRLL